MKKLLAIILSLACIASQGQTRFYFSINNAYNRGVAAGVNAGWDVSAGLARRALQTNKDASVIASKSSNAIGGVAPRKAIVDQYISAPLAAQTLNGTITGQMMFSLNSATSTTGLGFIYVRVVDYSGFNVIQEIGSMTTTALTTTLTNRTLSSITLTNVNINAGERLVVEIGWQMTVGTTTTRTGAASRGNNATDLPVNNTATTAGNPWIEVSQRVLFTYYSGYYHFL